MAINYTIKAQIVDIRVDVPRKEDRFLVDTNAWYWYSYARLHSPLIKNLPYKDRPKRYQVEKYPEYIDYADNNNSSLFYCGVSLSELAHIIENTERKIFLYDLFPKEYRHNYSIERAKLISYIEASWNQVELTARLIESTINQTSINLMIDGFKTHLVDAYDLIILQSMKNYGIKMIITDDGDFSSVPNILVFTANDNVVDAAKKQGKLFTR